MNKTCGECKHCTDKKLIATCKHVGITTGDVPGSNCKWFVPKVITNGDKIRQMSNDELAELFDNSCKVCSRDITECDVECVKGILEWLNAPAESEGEND